MPRSTVRLSCAYLPLKAETKQFDTRQKMATSSSNTSLCVTQAEPGNSRLGSSAGKRPPHDSSLSSRQFSTKISKQTVSPHRDWSALCGLGVWCQPLPSEDSWPHHQIHSFSTESRKKCFYQVYKAGLHTTKDQEGTHILPVNDYL